MEMLKLAIIAISILSWVIIEAYKDAELLNNKQYFASHTSRLASRCSVGIIVAVSFNPWLGAFTGLLFWALFDILLNIFRKGIEWNYIGSVANTDKYFKGRKNLYWLSKLLAFIIAMMIIIIQH